MKYEVIKFWVYCIFGYSIFKADFHIFCLVLYFIFRKDKVKLVKLDGVQQWSTVKSGLSKINGHQTDKCP